MLQSEFIFHPTTRFPQCHCSSIAELPNGDLLVAFYAGTYEAHPDQAILLVRKRAGSDGWEQPVVFADTPGKPEGNPVLFVDPAGRLFCFYGTMHGRLDGPPGPGVRWSSVDQKYRLSTDNGHTWSDDVMIREEWGYVFRTKPIVLENGDFILGVGCDEGGSRFLISDDQGATWFYSPPVGGVPHRHPTLIQRADGSLFALLRPQHKSTTPERLPRIGRSQSLDNGRTWTPGVYTDLPNHGSALDMVRLRDGRAALAFNRSERDRSRLTLALSEDEGETWPVMRDLETPPGSYEYPAIIEDRAGLIQVTYAFKSESGKRDRIKHVVLTPEWIEGKG